MTTRAEAKQSVYQEFTTGWGSITPTTFDNEPYSPAGEFARLTVRHLPNAQRTLGPPGARRFKRSAIAMVQVFTAVGVGTARSDQLVIVARDIFEGRSFGGLSFSNVNDREVGPDGDLYQVLVEAFFDYDETK